MNKDIENVIRANLPEKKGKYSQYNESATFGFNQALSQIDTKLIADEVLKVVVEKIKGMKLWSKGTVEGTRNDIINKLSNLEDK